MRAKIQFDWGGGDNEPVHMTTLTIISFVQFDAQQDDSMTASLYIYLATLST